MGSQVTLDAPSGWIVAQFNPWAYSDLESVLNGFFVTLRAALPNDRKWKDTRKRLGELGQAVSPLGKIAALVGFDASGILERGAKMIGGDTSVAATKKKAEEALRSARQPILMILDDLDRLAPDELLLVMKLVRLVGRLPYVFYLLAYDERTLRDVLKRTALVGDDDNRAADYLEKIVQVRLDIPALRDRQQSELVNRAFGAILNQYEIELSAEATHRMQLAYQEHLSNRLNTPRAINRFFGQVDAFYSVVREEVDFVDFTLMTWLRTTYPDVYSLLQQQKPDLTGTTPLVPHQTPSHAESLQRWRERLTSAGVTEADLDGVLGVLSLMFIPIRSARENMSYGATYIGDLGKRRGVGHIDYFDRYFTFGVPAEDIPDSTVLEALRQLSNGSNGWQTEQLTKRLKDDAERVVRKLAIQRAAGNTPAKPLLELLARTFDSQPRMVGLFRNDPRWSLRVLTCQLLSDLDATDGPSVLRAMSATDGGLSLASRAIDLFMQTAGSDATETGTLSWLADAKTTMLSLIRDRLTEATRDPLTDLSEDALELIWTWRRLDFEGLRSWLNQQTTSGNWTLLDVLARMIPTGAIAGGGGPARPTLGDVSLGVIDELFGLDKVMTQLKTDIDEVAGGGSWAVEPTMANRRRQVLQALRAERDARREAHVATESEAANHPDGQSGSR